MAEKTIDARGLSCPEPVLLVKQAMESVDRGTIEVLVDTVTSRENVTRLAKSLACKVDVVESGEAHFVLQVTKG